MQVLDDSALGFETEMADHVSCVALAEAFKPCSAVGCLRRLLPLSERAVSRHAGSRAGKAL